MPKPHRSSLAVPLVLVSMHMSMLATKARAENGVSDKEIRIGIVNDQSSPSDSTANAHYNAGARVLLEKLNKSGGINGRNVNARFYDDAYEPQKTIALTQKAIDEDKVFLLMNFSGTPTVKAVLPLIEKAKIPFLFPKTGDISPRQPLRPNVFNLRASYADEVTALLKEAISKRGMRALAILEQNDGFGAIMKENAVSAMRSLGFEKEIRDRHSAFVAEGLTQRNSLDVSAAYAKIAQGNPQAILLATPAGPAVPFVQKAQSESKKWLLLAASNNASLPEKLGSVNPNLIISQVMPVVATSQLPVVQRFRADMAAAGEQSHVNGIAFEGYLNALVATEAMKRAGADLTREALIKSLEGAPFDLGGIQVKYSATVHSAGPPITLTKQ